MRQQLENHPSQNKQERALIAGQDESPQEVKQEAIGVNLDELKQNAKSYNEALDLIGRLQKQGKPRTAIADILNDIKRQKYWTKDETDIFWHNLDIVEAQKDIGKRERTREQGNRREISLGEAFKLASERGWTTDAKKPKQAFSGMFSDYERGRGKKNPLDWGISRSKDAAGKYHYYDVW